MIPIRTGRQASRGGIPGGVAVVLEGITSLYPLHIDQDVSIRMREFLALTKPHLWLTRAGGKGVAEYVRDALALRRARLRDLPGAMPR